MWIFTKVQLPFYVHIKYVLFLCMYGPHHLLIIYQPTIMDLACPCACSRLEHAGARLLASVCYHTALCTIFTILLTLWNSEQKNGLLIKLFLFSSDFYETSWSFSYPCELQFHQVASKSDEKQKSVINSPFFCSEFWSVSRIMKIIHSESWKNWQDNWEKVK